MIAGLGADLVEINLQAGESLLAVLGEIAGQRQQDADLDRIGRACRQSDRAEPQRDRADGRSGAQRGSADRTFVQCGA